jgi:hypothetical protein
MNVLDFETAFLYLIESLFIYFIIFFQSVCFNLFNSVGLTIDIIDPAIVILVLFVYCEQFIKALFSVPFFPLL